MTPERLVPILDDHGDQFPGALPARTADTPARRPVERLVRMTAVAPRQEAAVPDTRPAETARTQADHVRASRATGHRTPTRGRDGRRPGQAATGLSRVRQLTRTSIARFDRYTLEVFNAGTPFRPDADRSA